MNTNHYDVVILGAGLSGIGAACHLTKQAPKKTYCILEGRSTSGGTWDLFKYPGLRSDSDMFTLGYSFKPWTSSQFLADGPSILNYIRESAKEYNVDDKIQYNSMVKSISWDSNNAIWTISYEDSSGARKKKKEKTCNFVSGCTGYYSYKGGYTPRFTGIKNFKGQIIHPQKWPEDLDYKRKKVIVIGSGATAVTVVPEIAKDAATVTMLQRSPTYMASVPGVDPSVELTRKLLPEKLAYRVSRTQKILLTYALFYGCQSFPKLAKKALLKHVKHSIGSDVDINHFSPHYNPWDERICAVKNGDLFKAVKKGGISMVTENIDRFTDKGILLKSGEELEADIIVTATGLNLEFMGGIEIIMDGEKFDVTESLNYKGVMFEGLPNLSVTFGYTNASWTLKADLTSEFVARILNHMDKKGFDTVTPKNNDPTIEKSNFLSFQSGYVQRSINKFPKMGSKLPWKLIQAYPVDLMMLRFGKLNDGKLIFSKSGAKQTDTVRYSKAS